MGENRLLRPARPGRLIGRVRFLKRTHEIVVVEASLADQDATVATGMATILIVSMETPDPVGD
jgi:acyl-coenzyme A thioesterase PaaI-like protein